MLIDTPRVCARANAALRLRTEMLERRLGQFRPEVSERVRSVAARHNWIADLAISFPALLFALAFPRRGVPGGDATQLAIAGASLPDIARAAGVPLWLRSFPANAFTAPIPDLPDNPAFRKRIANHLPKRWGNAVRWLDCVSNGWRWGDEEIALWLAREAPVRRPKLRGPRKRPARDLLRLVCLWSWYSQRPETQGGSAIRTRWNPEMQWAAATGAAFAWTDALTLRLWLGEAHLSDMWLEPGRVDGYAFVPLRSRAEIEAESDEMQNCVRTYGFDLATNYHRIWSIRRDDVRVATLCLGSAFPSAPLAHIVELSGPKNVKVEAPVWVAARKWLHQQDESAFSPGRLTERATARYDASTWRELWRPYWLAKGTIPSWLPISPSGDAVHAI